MICDYMYTWRCGLLFHPHKTSPQGASFGSKNVRIQSRPSPARQQMWEAKQVDRWCQQRLREMLVPATVQLDAGLIWLGCFFGMDLGNITTSLRPNLGIMVNKGNHPLYGQNSDQWNILIYCTQTDLSIERLKFHRMKRDGKDLGSVYRGLNNLETCSWVVVGVPSFFIKFVGSRFVWKGWWSAAGSLEHAVEVWLGSLENFGREIS